MLWQAKNKHLFAVSCGAVIQLNVLLLVKLVCSPFTMHKYSFTHHHTLYRTNNGKYEHRIKRLLQSAPAFLIMLLKSHFNCSTQSNGFKLDEWLMGNDMDKSQNILHEQLHGTVTIHSSAFTFTLLHTDFADRHTVVFLCYY